MACLDYEAEAEVEGLGGMLDGSLGEDAFTRSCQALVQQPQAAGDGWHFVTLPGAPGGGYLRKVELVILPSVGTESAASCLQCETSFEVDDDSASTFTSEKGLTARFEYHVVYSLSYAVPVLYLNAHTLDGRRLSLDSILSRASLTLRAGLDGAGTSRVSGAESQDGDDYDGRTECAIRWDGLTQQEHPLLGHPFYVLHPCRTAQLLQPIVGLAHAERRQLNYLFCFPFMILWR
uniref:ubiquitin-like-conjugating enzyme ATG10 isoform X2 n=1 Tax=Myxine glutinosa TaxID=7769 RepID=UPI00358F5432